MHISITLALFFGLSSARVTHVPVVESPIGQPESIINDTILAPLELAAGPKTHAKLAKRSLQTQNRAPWGLRAISHRNPAEPYTEFPPPKNSKYYYDDNAGAGTFAYILDSGIRTTHEEFEGRATTAHSIYPAGKAFDGDHGTGVAGIIGSKTYGVAKKATLISVHLLGPTGCSASEAINALLWTAEDIMKNSRKDKSVINLSMGIPKVRALNAFVERLIVETDVPVVVTTGNEAADASNHSPGSANGVIAVGSVDQHWAIGQSSNFGSAVSILAPGVRVETTGAGSDTNAILQTGTSFAAAYISGLVLNAISVHGIKGAASVKKHILETATKDKACFPPEKGTPNLVGNNKNSKQVLSSIMFCCNGALSKLGCSSKRPMKG